MARRAMVLDLNRCVGCLSCVVACKVENDVEASKYWTWVKRVGPIGKFPDTKMHFLPYTCQHCDTPECISVCPANATYKRADGIVLVDAEKCIGCESCIEACPYEARSMDSRSNTARKCTLCTQLIDTGAQAHCALNCPGKARVIGDIDDSNSEAARLIKEAGPNAYRLHDSGNSPVGYYILRNMKWSL